MKPHLYVVELEQEPILQQLQWEEALLRADSRNWCLLNRGSPPAIVLGISGQVQQLIHQERWIQEPLPLIRRFSGGGTVVVDENTLFVTLICQAQAVPVPAFPRPLMQWTAELYRPLFASQPFHLKENDYVIGEHKWGGNAQSLIKGRWLHHSSLLWDFNPAYMSYLLQPPKMPAYRQERSHTDFLCRLKDYWPDCHTFQNAFIEQLGQQFEMIQTEKKELEQVAALPHRKATHLIEKILPKGTGECTINIFCASGSIS